MKKLLVWMTMICMILALPFSGMADGALQDEQPPALAVGSNASGENVYAVIVDAQGNEIAQITESGALVLTDIHHRHHDDSKDHMADAYQGVMDNVHHSDVECQLHEHDVKVDINAVLNSMEAGIDAHDLVMYEFFDVALPDAVAALIPEGGKLKVTLKVDPVMNVPLIAMFTADGANWIVVPVDSNGDTITLLLPGPGSIAFLCDGVQFLGLGQTEIFTTTIVTTVTEEELNNFTPSVSGKPSPQLVVHVDTHEEIIVGYIYNDVDDTVISVPAKNYVKITALSERSQTVDIQTYEHLEWAYDSILAAEDIGELMSDNHEGSIAGDLDALLQQMGLDLTHDQLVVKDLFEVTAYGDYLHHLYDEEHYMELTFDPAVDPEKPLIVIHSMDSVNWHVHANENVIRNADGTVTVRMYDLGAVAFLTEAEYFVDAEGAVQAP